MTVLSYEDIIRLKNGQRELGARAYDDDSFDESIDNARADIVAKAKIDIILYSLPKSFKDFRFNAVMCEKLITVEGVLVLNAQVSGFAKNIFLYRKVKKKRVLRARKRRQIVGATVLALLVGLYNHQ